MSGLQGEGKMKGILFVLVLLDDIIMDTRRKLLLIRYRFGELIID